MWLRVKGIEAAEAGSQDTPCEDFLLKTPRMLNPGVV